MMTALLLAVLLSIGPSVQTFKVDVDVPVEHDWVYTGKGACKLDVNLSSETSGGRLVLSLDLVTDTSLMSKHRDTVLTVTRDVRLRKGARSLTLNMGKLAPGFYQVNLSVQGAEASFKPQRVFNIGVRPEEIVSPQDKQPDFDEFWNATLAELAKVPVDAEYTLDPEHSDSLRSTYIVKFKSFGGETVGGILCKPNKPGKYTTYIDYLGYGANIIWYEPSAAPQTVEFLLSVRDQGIFKRKGHYRWIDRGLESKEEFYYRGAFCDVVRAIDFVSSLDCVDPDYLFARGESQGGAFTFISVSLDHRIKACAPSVPFLADYPDYWRIVRWPMWEVFEECDKKGISRDELMTMLSYFDIKNFADRIECPMLMAFGLQDGTCPPHTNFAAYNLVPAPKEYYCGPLLGHGLWCDKDWYAARAAWFAPREKK